MSTWDFNFEMEGGTRRWFRAVCAVDASSSSSDRHSTRGVMYCRYKVPHTQQTNDFFLFFFRPCCCCSVHLDKNEQDRPFFSLFTLYYLFPFIHPFYIINKSPTKQYDEKSNYQNNLSSCSKRRRVHEHGEKYILLERTFS